MVQLISVRAAAVQLRARRAVRRHPDAFPASISSSPCDLWHLPCVETVVEWTALPGHVDLPRSIIAPDVGTLQA